jgi:hypothetical protein
MPKDGTNAKSVSGGRCVQQWLYSVLSEDAVINGADVNIRRGDGCRYFYISANLKYIHVLAQKEYKYIKILLGVYYIYIWVKNISEEAQFDPKIFFRLHNTSILYVVPNK